MQHDKLQASDYISNDVITDFQLLFFRRSTAVGLLTSTFSLFNKFCSANLRVIYSQWCQKYTQLLLK